MIFFLWLLPFFWGCAHKKKSLGIEGSSTGNGVFLTTFLQEGWKAKNAEIRYLSWEGLFALEEANEDVKEKLFEIALGDPERFVREEAVRFVWEKKDLKLLKKAFQSEKLSDGERCLLALDIFSLSQEASIGAWPIHSEASLEDRFFCALGASTILKVTTPWHALLKTGDYPLSVSVVDSIVNFASPEELLLFETELEWAEEGIRASLWAGWMLVDPSKLPRLKKKLIEFSEEECLEMVDIAWRHPKASGATELLNHLQKQSGFCGKMADIVLISKGEKGLLGVENIFKKGGREEIVTLLLALERYPYSSGKQKRKMRLQIEKLVIYDQDPFVLSAAIQVLGMIGDRGSQKKMKDLLEKNIDRHILIEIEKSYNQIEKDKGR